MGTTRVCQNNGQTFPNVAIQTSAAIQTTRRVEPVVSFPFF